MVALGLRPREKLEREFFVAAFALSQQGGSRALQLDNATIERDTRPGCLIWTGLKPWFADVDPQVLGKLVSNRLIPKAGIGPQDLQGPAAASHVLWPHAGAGGSRLTGRPLPIRAIVFRPSVADIVGVEIENIDSGQHFSVVRVITVQQRLSVRVIDDLEGQRLGQDAGMPSDARVVSVLLIVGEVRE